MSLDDLIINTNAMSGKFDIDCGLGFETKIVGSEMGEEIWLSWEKGKCLDE